MPAASDATPGPTDPRGGWPPRGHLAVLLLCAIGVIAHQWIRLDWFIDDSAIVFAYARNLAEGHGFVPWPGGERIEAFSDPTWLALFVVFEWLGFNGFQVAKPLAMAFTVACLPVAYQLARDAQPGRATLAPLIAPIFLALNAQIAIWSASALENSLFFLLMLLAVRSTAIDARTGRLPRSAVWFLLLAFTRPDGLAYAAIGGVWYLGLRLRAGTSLRPVAWWLAVFWVPYGAFELWRLWYFAWPLPNTYYAKLEARDPFPLAWGARGWGQLREYAARLWHGYYLPVYLAGLVGLTGRRAAWAFAAAGLVALTLAWPGPDVLRELWFWPSLPDLPRPLTTARVIALYAGAALLPLAVRGRPGGPVLGLCWHQCAATLAFGIYANGDWMGGYRWMSLAMPTASILFAVGVVEWADRLETAWSGAPRWDVVGWVVAALLVCGLVPPNFSQTRDHTLYNRNETPVMVRRRAEYTKRITRRLFYEEQVVNLEMDQGAHLFWRPEYIEVDMAGLVDIAMARHRYDQDAFIRQYVFEEMKPTFAHVHGGWAKGTRLEEYPEWAEMFELPPYDDAELGPHRGVWARRSLILHPRYRGPTERHAAFGSGFELVGFDVPNREWGRDRYAFLEAAFRTEARDPGPEPTVVCFVTDGHAVRSWSLPMGHGLVDMAAWRDDVFVGRWALRLPPDLPLGRYEIGFVAFDGSGQVLAAGGADGALVVASTAAVATTEDDAVVAIGEVRWSGLIEVVEGHRVEPLAAAKRDEAVAWARDGRCEAAEDRWTAAKRQIPYLYGWHDAEAPAVARALADCWAARAEGDPDSAPEHLARAHRWDPTSPVLAEVGAPFGDRLWQDGLQARRAGRHADALRLFTRLLRFQPWRSWARRHAEASRDKVLGLDDG